MSGTDIRTAPGTWPCTHSSSLRASTTVTGSALKIQVARSSISAVSKVLRSRPLAVQAGEGSSPVVRGGRRARRARGARGAAARRGGGAGAEGAAGGGGEHAGAGGGGGGAGGRRAGSPPPQLIGGPRVLPPVRE